MTKFEHKKLPSGRTLTADNNSSLSCHFWTKELAVINSSHIEGKGSDSQSKVKEKKRWFLVKSILARTWYNSGYIDKNMKQTLPFLPRLNMTRHLSTILEKREDNEDFDDDECPFGRPVEGTHRRFQRRVHSCGDLAVSRECSKPNDILILPVLPCLENTHRQALLRKGTATKDSYKACSDQNIFPDFRPSDRNRNEIDLDTKTARNSSRSNTKRGGNFSHNKENIVASWLQFFG